MAVSRLNSVLFMTETIGAHTAGNVPRRMRIVKRTPTVIVTALEFKKNDLTT